MPLQLDSCRPWDGRSTTLATNNVRHAPVGSAGRGDFYVRALLFHGWLRVEVLDAYGRAPSLRVVTPGTRAGGGRGLVLVNALASRWGSFQSLRGTGMFFELRWRVPEPLAPVAPAVPLPRKDW